jgi:hypothetical protein
MMHKADKLDVHVGELLVVGNLPSYPCSMGNASNLEHQLKRN